MDKERRWKVWFVLLLVGLVGGGLVALVPRLEGLVRDLASHFGVALLTAAVLGFGVDIYMKQSLAEDAFKASIGYILPDELKEEMRWLYGHTVIVASYTRTFTITPIAADAVRLHVDEVRQYKNISDRTQEIDVGLAVDEWSKPQGNTEIIRLGYQVKDGDRREVVGAPANDRRGYYVHAGLGKVKLPSKGTMDQWSEWVEIRDSNDTHFDRFSYPTKDPIIHVQIPDGYDRHVAFGHRAQAELVQLGPHRFKLPGTLVPMQVIEFRWWRKADAEATTTPKAAI